MYQEGLLAHGLHRQPVYKERLAALVSDSPVFELRVAAWRRSSSALGRFVGSSAIMFCRAHQHNNASLCKHKLYADCKQ